MENSQKRKKQKKDLVNYKHLLSEILKERRLPAPRYELLQVSAPEEKAMGYYAPAFTMRVVVGGMAYDSDKPAKSKDRAGHRAACVAYEALRTSGSALAEHQFTSATPLPGN